MYTQTKQFVSRAIEIINRSTANTWNVWAIMDKSHCIPSNLIDIKRYSTLNRNDANGIADRTTKQIQTGWMAFHFGCNGFQRNCMCWVVW